MSSLSRAPKITAVHGQRAARAAVPGAAIAVVVLATLLTTEAVVAQPATPPPGTPGATIATAVVLPGITDEFHGVVAEHTFIANHFPTWHIEYSARFTQNDHNYDVLGMVEPDKTKVPIYFDITAWVGK